MTERETSEAIAKELTISLISGKWSTSDGARSPLQMLEDLQRVWRSTQGWVTPHHRRCADALDAVIGKMAAPAQNAASVEAFDLSEIPRDAAKRERAHEALAAPPANAAPSDAAPKELKALKFAEEIVDAVLVNRLARIQSDFNIH